MKRQRLYVSLAVFCLIFSLIGMALTGCDKGNNSTETKPAGTTPVETTPEGKSIPVYQGMSISKSDGSLLAPSEMPRLVSLASWSHQTKPYAIPLGNDEEEAKENGDGIETQPGLPEKEFECETNAPYEGDIEDVVTIEVPGDEVTKYYVTPGETFTVEVYLYNPDQYEIQSFTLNGVKYANYMFKENSTLELLRLDVTAPEVPGYFELTIDAIKYIDGTEIKDVRMDGDKTIKAGVTYPEVPHVEFSDIVVGATSVSMTVDLSDPYGVLSGSEFPARFFISDGSSIAAELNLQVGANAITVHDLLMGTAYEYGVLVAYDPVDGTGMAPYWLGTQLLETQDGFLVSDVTIGQEGLDFVLEQTDATAKLTAIIFVDELTGETALTLEDLSLRTVGGLISDHDYRMVLKYEYTREEAVIQDDVAVSFTTLKKTIPELSIEKVNVTQTEIFFDLIVADVDDILTIDKIELYSGDEVVSTAADNTVRTFGSLLTDHTYTVSVTYSYDLGDGAGVHTETVETVITTQPRTAPVVSIRVTDVKQTTLSFAATAADPDAILVINAIELLDADQVIAASENFEAPTFTDLLTNHAYTLRITYSYDLGDGAGIHTETVETKTTTRSRTAPVVDIRVTDVKQTTVSFAATAVDPDAILVINAIELLDADQVVAASENFEAPTFTDLLTNHAYTLKITYSYDLGDGAGIHTETVETKTTTRSRTAPVVDIRVTDVKQTTLSFAATAVDPDAILVINAIELLDADQVIAASENFEAPTFTDLLTNHAYTLRITYSYDLGDGAGVHTETAICSGKTLPKTVPQVSVSISETTQNKLTFDIGIIDPDTILSVTAVELLYDGHVVATVPYTDHIAFSELEAGTLYTARVTYTYDLGDGAGVQTKTAERQYPTLAASILVDEVVLMNENVVKKGEEINLSIFFNNSSRIELLNIYVNGQKVEVVGGNRIDRAIVKFVPDETGLVVFSVDRVEYLYYGETITQRIDSDVTVTYPVYGDLDVRFEPVSISPYEYTGTGIFLEFDNSDGYKVYSINGSTDYIALSDHEFFVNSTRIDSIEYGYDHYGSTKQAFTYYKDSEKWCGDVVEIYTVEEFLNMGSGYYILMNDLDLSRWKADYTIRLYGILDGNGHTITGLSGIVDTGTKEYEPIITGGSIYDTTFVDVYFNVTHSKDYWISVSPFGDARLINCNVSGDVTVHGSNFSEFNMAYHNYKNSTGYSVRVTKNGTSKQQTFTPTARLSKKVCATFDSGYVYYVFPNGDALFLQGLPQGQLFVRNFEKLYTDDTNGLTYALSNHGTATVIGFDGSVTELVIPKEINGHAVVAINDGLFSENKTLVSLEILAEIPVISNRMFYGCTALTTVQLPASVTAIGEYAFYGCSRLETVTFGENSALATIGSHAFESCNKLITIEIPASVTTIGSYAFAWCSSMTSVTFAEGSELTTIGERAFCCCQSLTDLTLPGMLEIIGTYAFSDCNSLTTLYIPASVTVIEDLAFPWCWNLTLYVGASEKPAGWSDNWNSRYQDNDERLPVVWGVDGFYTDEQGLAYLHMVDGTATVIGYDGTVTDLVIPKEIDNFAVVAINSGLFSGNETLVSVVILAEVPEISNWMFNSCTALTTVKLPASVTAIGEGAFSGCSSLETVTFGENSALTTIGSYAFANCNKLITIEIPASVTTIGEGAFGGCSSLETVTFGENSALTTIGSYAFNNCIKLVSIEIPASVTTIGEYAFYDCSSLETVTFGENSALTIISSYAFNNCIKLVSIEIPASVTVIGNSAFSSCSRLETVTIGESSALTTIGSYAFHNCSKLVYVEIPASVTTIGEYAFYGCSRLETVTFGENSALATIGSHAFESCNKLITIEIPASVTTIGSYAFAWCSSMTSVTFAEGSELTTIGERAFCCCQSLTDLTLPGMLEIIGTYAFSDCNSLTTLYIPVSIIEIGEYAFQYCGNLTLYVGASEKPAGWEDDWNSRYESSDERLPVVWGVDGFYTDDQGLTYVLMVDGTATVIGYDGTVTDLVIPKEIDNFAVVAINSGLFSGNETLVSVEILAELPEISNQLFNSCTALTTVKLPASVTAIGEGAFGGCSSLETVTFGENSALTTIGSYAFNNCIKLVSIEIPASVTTIGEYAFYDCSSLETVTFGENSALMTIGSHAFESCNKLITIEIPASVTVIGNSAFSSCSRLETVTFGESSALTTIGSYAFHNCSKLVNIEIPASVTTIGEYAFSSCSHLETVTFGENSALMTIGSHAFESCNKLITIEIPASITTIGDYTFAYCNSLTDITLPGTLEIIGANAFNNCNSLTTLHIPASVTVIEDFAFHYCWNLTLYVGASEKPVGWSDDWDIRNEYDDTKLSVVWGVDGFYTDDQGLTYLLMADGTATVIGYDGTVTDLVIPKEIDNFAVVAINSGLFSGNETLVSVEILAELPEISNWMFNSCTALTTVKLPASVTAIGEWAFSGCSSLETVTFGEESKLTAIGNHAFRDCGKLLAVEIPASVTTIGYCAFYSCSSLETVTFGENSTLAVIGDNAFYGCLKLLAVEIPASVMTIGDHAFYYCSCLETVTFDKNSVLTTISSYAFDNCKKLVSIEIPASVTTIGERAFGMCSSLETVTFGENSALATIGSHAFANCNKLITIEIPASVTTIGSGAFCYCSSMTSVTLAEESKLTTIGESAFAHCNSLTDITLPGTLETIGAYAFSYCYDLTTLYIPASTIEIGEYAFQYCGHFTLYVEASEKPDGWSDDWNSRNNYNDEKLPVVWGVDGFHTDEQGLTYVLMVDGTATVIGYDGTATDLVIPGTVEGYTVVALKSFLFIDNNTLKSIEIPASVTTIGERAFSSCSRLETVIFGENSALTTIGSYAFHNCSKLVYVEIPASVTTIGEYAFSSCSRLETVTFGKSSALTTIGSYAFHNCSKLVYVEIPASVTTVGEYAFSSCSRLETVTFGENSALTTIGSYAFASCNKLITIEIPASVTTIESYAFAGCYSMTSVTFAEGSKLTTIGERAFESCQSLTDITLPGTLETIGAYAFYNCYHLSTLYIPVSTIEIGKYAFQNCGNLTLYVGAFEKPVGWSDDWDIRNEYDDTKLSVVWGIDGFYTDDQGLTYLLMADGTATVFGYDGTATDLVIPGTVEGYTVVALKSYLFNNNNTLKSIVIPASVTAIGEAAFRVCSSLETVIFGENSKLTIIGNDAFHGCEKLLAIEIPASVTAIGEYAFYDCSSLETVTFGENSALATIGRGAFHSCNKLITIEIPASVTTIESDAFAWCSSMTSVTFADGSCLITIGDYTFAQCHSLTDITLPDTLKTIGAYAFSDCNSLITLYIPVSTIEIGEYAFRSCSWLTLYVEASEKPDGWSDDWDIRNEYDDTKLSVVWGVDGFYTDDQGLTYLLMTDGTATVFGYDGTVTDLVIPGTVEGYTVVALQGFLFENNNTLKSIEIPSSVTAIGEAAFRGCSSLETVIFGENSKLTIIGNDAFHGCEKLLAIEIPASVTAIGKFAFCNCKSLKTATFGENSTLAAIGNSAFHGCEKLLAIEIPASVTAIEEWAFYGCTRLETVIFGENSALMTIGSHAFESCNKLITIEIPVSVTVIGNSAFNGCSRLETVTFGENSALTTIGSYAFYNCNKLVSLEIPASVTTIGSHAFESCNKLITIVIPASVTTIESYAFAWCSSMTSVTFAEGNALIAIKDYAFYYCGSLNDITLPGTLETIGAYAFSGCNSLITLYIPALVTVIEDFAFHYCWNLTLYVEVSEKPDGWSDDWDTRNEYDGEKLPVIWGVDGFYTDDQGLTYVLVVDGTARGIGYDGTATDLIIPGTVEGYTVVALKSSLFIDNKTLKSVVVPASVTAIGERAFSSCSRLETVTFGENSALTTIGSYAFANCNKLITIEVPASVSTIGSYAFSWCSSMTSVTFAEGSKLTTIGERAFEYCQSLTDITLPGTLETIGAYAFDNCYSLTTLYIPVSTIEIGEYAFKYCGNLTLYVGASEKPDGWSDDWDIRYQYNDEKFSVVWGATFADSQK